MAEPVAEVAHASAWSGKKDEKRDVKWLKHYSSAQSILIVGDDDFSFFLALATAFGSGENLVSTSLNSYGYLTTSYTKAESNITELQRMGATVLHHVDVTWMKSHAYLKVNRFDRIVFNFPHAGFTGHETQLHMINSHKELLRAFFGNASGLLRPDGEIHVTHKTGNPYNRWELEQLASESSLVMFEKQPFWQFQYLGYNQKRGAGARCDYSFPISGSYTYKFRMERNEADECALIPLTVATD